MRNNARRQSNWRTKVTGKIVSANADGKRKNRLGHFIHQSRFACSRTLKNGERVAIAFRIVFAEDVFDGFAQKARVPDKFQFESTFDAAPHYNAVKCERDSNLNHGLTDRIYHVMRVGQFSYFHVRIKALSSTDWRDRTRDRNSGLHWWWHQRRSTRVERVAHKPLFAMEASSSGGILSTYSDVYLSNTLLCLRGGGG
jgi:hypothetical protein